MAGDEPSNGQPIGEAKASEVVEGLPVWCRGFAYHSKTNTMTMRALVPIDPTRSLPVDFIIKPAGAEAMVRAIQRLLDESKRIIVDVT